MVSNLTSSASAVSPASPVARRTRHIDFLDQVRGVAILAVFVYHVVGAATGYDRLPWHGWHRRLPATALGWLVAPARFGWAGVPIFFVVSGFCIHLSFRRRPEWRDFFMRRFFRIYPPYVLALLFFAFVLPLTRLDFADRRSLVQLGTHLALVHNFGNTTLAGINGAFWSIAIEIQLYALYPALLFLADRFGWKTALGTTAVVEFTLRASGYAFLNHIPGKDPFETVPALLGGSPLSYWFSWSVGAYLAEAHLHDREQSLVRLCHPAVLLPLAVAGEMIKGLAAFSFTLFSLATAGVIAWLLVNDAPTWRLPPFLSRRLAGIGLWSYSIYLLHLPLVVWVTIALRTHLPGAWNRPALIFCLTLSTWWLIKPLSGLWYRCCELPGIALGKRAAAALAG